MDKEQQKYYSKGYAVGSAKKQSVIKSIIAEAKIEGVKNILPNRFDSYFCAALTGLLSTNSNWSIGKESVNNAEKYVKLARIFAKESMKQLMDK